MTSFLVEADAVAKAFDGVPALRNGVLQLRPGSVHALCGGNGAGKSTFLNILMGFLQRDSGTIRVRGDEVNFTTPAEALAARIAIITQELAPVPEMTVAENIFLGREPRRGGFVVDHRRMEEDTQKILSEIGFDLDPKKQMADLSLAQIQLVEITRALSLDAEIVIMDEPTSAIGEHETHILFDAIRRLQTKGVGVIYVSHRLEELFEIADTYTVFRDGQFIQTGPMQSLSREELVALIVGHELHSSDRSERQVGATPLLQVDRLSVRGKVRGISLSVAPGEVVGLYGLMGAGRSEFLNAVYGIGPRDGGTVTMAGETLSANRPDLSIRNRIAMVTEDRKHSGLVLPASIRHNISLSILGRLSRFGILRRREERDTSARMSKKLAVKAASDQMAVSALSGGNQQKVVIARCLSSEPQLLICDEPTRGIDEGAKQEIYGIIDEFVANGGAVLMASSEAQELLQVCDRIAIFKKGALVRIVPRSAANQQNLLHDVS